jgi:hypothetical protein
MRNSDSDPSTSPAPVQPIAFQALTAEQLAPLFPRLEIGAPIAVGGMGAVYLARQPELDRRVALKILPPELCAEAEYLERFRSEARAMAQLNHPNLVGVHDFGETGGYFYFIMEYVEGQNLAELLQNHGGFGPEFTLPVMLHICDGMAYAHGKGVIHLDLKPGNIMLNNEGMVKILDFGLAKLLDPVTGSAEEDMGTPDYAAPERYRKGAAIDHRADIFSMGVVLFEMLVGKVPKAAGGLASQASERVDSDVDTIIHRSTRTDQGARYQSAAEFRSDLAKAEKKAQKQLLKSPNAAKLLLSSNAGPQVAAAAKVFRRRLKRQMLLRKLRKAVVLLVVLGGAAFGAWWQNLIPETVLAKLGLPSPPAKMVGPDEMAPMFPKLAELYGTLNDQIEMKIDAPRADALEGLHAKYDKALANLEKSSAAAGNGDLADAVTVERNRFGALPSVPTVESTLSELAKLQGVLKNETQKIADKAGDDRRQLFEKYDAALGRLQTELKGEGETENAERVGQERERVAEEI